MDGKQLGAFVRSRRARIRPADVNIAAYGARRVEGLRRDEVARLAALSTEYYVEIEQGRSSPPSIQVLTALARALRLTRDEHDHLLHLAGYPSTSPAPSSETDPGLLDLLTRLEDIPAQIRTDLWDVLAQNQLAEAMLGRLPIGQGLHSNIAYQWFTGPRLRSLCPASEHDAFSRTLAADLRAATARRPSASTTTRLIEAITAASQEFAALWDDYQVAVRRRETKGILHPDGTLCVLNVHRVENDDRTQHLQWFTPRGRAIDSAWPVTVDLTSPGPVP